MAKKQATAMESPQLPDDSAKEAPEAPKPSEQDNTANTEAELAEVMGMLKQFEINSPEKVENVVKASQQTGRMAQLLGEQRETNRQLMAKLEALEKKGMPQSYQANDGYEEKPIDLEGTIENVLSRFWTKKQQEQAQMTQQQWAAFNEIQTDDDYLLVKDAWDNYVRQPDVAYSFQSGTSDPVKEYNKFVRKFQRKLLHRTRGLLEQVTTGTKKKTPPHVEQGTNVPPMPEEPTDFMEKKKAIQEKYRGKATDDGVSELLKELLPEGDPLFMRR